MDNNDSFIVKQQNKFESAEHLNIAEANRISQELDKHLSLIATVLVGLIATIIASNSDRIDNTTLQYLFIIMSALVVSLLFVILQYIAADRFFTLKAKGMHTVVETIKAGATIDIIEGKIQELGTGKIDPLPQSYRFAQILFLLIGITIMLFAVHFALTPTSCV